MQSFCIIAGEDLGNRSMIDILVVDPHFMTEKKWKQYQKVLINSSCTQSDSPNGFMYHAVVVQ